MKINRKIKLLLTLIIIFTSFACCFIACKDEENNDNNYLELNQSEVNILIGETILLEAKYNVLDNTELVFSVDDNSIATVNKVGLVTGEKLGETIITVQYGECIATCTIKVQNEGLLPSFEFIYGVDDKETCFVGDGINFNGKISFNDVEYTDVSISYISSNSDIAFVDENGILNAKKAGKTEINVTANWRGFKRVKTISVTVLDKVECCINGGESSSISIYTINATYNGENFSNEETVETTVNVNGNNVNFTLSSLDEDVFIVENNNKVFAVKAGSSAMKVDFSYENKDYSFTFDVQVIKPTFEAQSEIEFFDANKGVGEKTISQIFNNADLSNISKVTAENQQGIILSAELNFKAENGSTEEELMGVVVNGKEKVKQIISLESDNVIYKVTITPYTAVISNKDEFLSTFPAPESGAFVGDIGYEFPGYYVLDNDIDFGGTSTVSMINHKNGLSGTFDGLGHSILNANIYFHGLFGKISGVIRNFALIDCELNSIATNSNSCGIFGDVTSSAVMENIYVKFKSRTYNAANAGRYSNALSYKQMPVSAKISNFVLDSSAISVKLNSNDYWEGFFPYSTSYDIFSTNNNNGTVKANKNLNTLNKNQTNVYFITQQYLATFELAGSFGVIEAGNRRNEPYNSLYVGGKEQTSLEIVYVDSFYRYNNITDMINATKSGQASDYSDFTNTGLWTWDAYNGLAWRGNI